MLFLTFLAFFSGSIFIMGVGYACMRMCVGGCCQYANQQPYHTIPDNI